MMANTSHAAHKPILLVMRPRESSERFLALFPKPVLRDVSVMISPLFELVAYNNDRNNARALQDVFGPGEKGRGLEDTHLIMTSANVLKFLPKGDGERAYCVGRHSTNAARAAGYEAVFCGETADALVDELSKIRPPWPLIHVVGRHHRGQICERLTAAGLKAWRHIVYEQRAVALSPEALAALRGEARVILPLFSPRSAMLLVEHLVPALEHARHHETKRFEAIAISESTAEPLRNLSNLNVFCAKAPDMEQMYECTLARLMTAT